MIKGSHHTEKTLKRMRSVHLGKIISQETKDKLSRIIKGRPAPWLVGKKLSKEHGEKIGKANHTRIVSEETRAKIKANGRKQIIEMFGDYWHGGKARNYEETEEGRIKLFKKYGFETLIIWECELKDILTVENRIKKFHQGATR